MMSVKAMFAVSMGAIGASTLGVSAYVATHPTGSTGTPVVEAELAPVPPTRFEFALASSIDAEKSTAGRELMLDPVTIYGRDSASIGAPPPPKAVLQQCSPWRP